MCWFSILPIFVGPGKEFPYGLVGGRYVVYFIGWVFLRSVVVVGVRVICRAHADVLAKTVYGGVVEAVWDVVWVGEGWAKGEVDLFSEVIEGASGSIE